MAGDVSAYSRAQVSERPLTWGGMLVCARARVDVRVHSHARKIALAMGGGFLYRRGYGPVGGGGRPVDVNCGGGGRVADN